MLKILCGLVATCLAQEEAELIWQGMTLAEAEAELDQVATHPDFALKGLPGYINTAEVEHHDREKRGERQIPGFVVGMLMDKYLHQLEEMRPDCPEIEAYEAKWCEFMKTELDYERRHHEHDTTD